MGGGGGGYLAWPGGTYLSWGTYLGWGEGVPTLAMGDLSWLGGTYLGQGEGYLPWLGGGGTYLGQGKGVSTLAGGRRYLPWSGGTYLGWGRGYLSWPGGVPPPLPGVNRQIPDRQILRTRAAIKCKLFFIHLGFCGVSRSLHQQY